jgi:spermidine synthase
LTESKSTPVRPGPRSGLGAIELTALGLFFLSGASALVYEVVWTRGLTNVFGGSAFAIATVLAAYMAGLALGSTVFGRSIDRRGHPLVVYGLLEGAIGLWALILPVLLGFLDHFYAQIYQSLNPGFYGLSLIRFVLCFLLLLVPTTMMGGTLPVLGKLLLSNWGGLGNRAGLLYGINTLGAVVGVSAGGFMLLPALGLRGSTWVAIGFNLFVAVAAVAASRRFPYRPEPVPPAAPEPASRERDRSLALRRAVLIVYAASGFAALAYEVAWTKTLSLILGTTSYAFTSMLTTFLLGLALGSFIFGKLVDRKRARPETLLALVQLGIPILALLSIPMLGRLPQLFVNGFPELKDSWFALELYRILLAAGVMFLPTLLMGGTFPLVTRAYADRREVGKSLGSLYAANTVGAIFGSFLTGFVLIPWVGRQNSILAASFVNLAAVALLLGTLRWKSVGRKSRWAMAVLVVLLAPAWVIGLQRWNPRILSAGAYIYADELAKKPSIEEAMAGTNLLFSDEGTEAIVSVWQDQYNVYLRTSGKVEASNHGDMVTQKLISHLPVLYHEGEVEDGLMIGLASGISVGALLRHPFERVQTVELIPSMAEAARYFDDYNYQVLDDPRHELIINDGRNHLLLTDEKYDVIVSEPSNPWIAGIGALFTREFFELTKQRLKPGGVVCQWVQTYQFRETDLKTVLATFVDAYPYIHLWSGAPGDLILVASLDPLRLDMDRMRRTLAGPAGDDLRHLEILPEGQLLAHFVTDRDGIQRYVEGWDRRVTDDNLYLEYAVPRHMFEEGNRISVVNLEPVSRSVLPFVTGAEGDSTLLSDLDRERRARAITLRARYANRFPVGAEDAEQAWEMALAIAPEDQLTRRILSNFLNERAIRLLQAGDRRAAEPIFRRVSVMGERGERALALNNLGAIAFDAGRSDSAETFWEATLAEEPSFTTAWFNLSLIAAQRNQPELVVDYLRRVVKTEVANALALNNLAWNLALVGRDLEEAETVARRAVDIDSRPNFLDTLGYVLLQCEKWNEAEKVLSRASREAPDNLEALFHLGLAQVQLGRAEEAQAAFRRVAEGAVDENLAQRARDELNKF